MQDLPPKALKTQLVHLDHNLKEIERSQFAGIQRAPGSLPVLEAFQGFLDQERKIARKRLMAVTALSIFLLLLISGSGAVFIYMQMKNMAVDYTTLTTKANALESQLNTKTQATQTQLSALKEYLNNNAANHTQLLTAHSNVATKATQDHEQITEMQASLENLATENAFLKEQIENIVKDWQTIKQRSEVGGQRSEVGAQLTTTAPKDTPIKPSVGARPAAPGEPKAKTTTDQGPRTKDLESSVELTIIPPNQKHGIRWRLPRLNQ